MCDTWVAMHDATAAGNVLFGKNSDRPIFDCQPLAFYPARAWPAGSRIELEYLVLPQAGQTYATLGSSPYWCWGYEEGINEHGVVIGNEAIFTNTFRDNKAAYQAGRGPELGLLGMDLVRLALERSRTASQAVEQIAAWVEQYGQFGSGVPGSTHADGGYDNAFLIADPAGAWVLEAVGKRWVAKQIRSGYDSISNQPTIRRKWDAGSADVREHAVQKGFWPADQQAAFDFAQAYVDEAVPRQVSHIRLMRSRQLLAEKAGAITPQWMMRIARDHYEGTFLDGPCFDAADPDFHSLCMHVSAADFTWGNTASSCVAVLPESAAGFPVFWWTPGPPCNGCYVPFFVHGSSLPQVVSNAGQVGKRVIPPPEAPQDTFGPRSYWWLFRHLMDEVKGDPVRSVPNRYPDKNRTVRAAFDALETEFAADLPAVLDKAAAVRARDPTAVAQVLDAFTVRCVRNVLAVLQDLLQLQV